MTATLYVIDNPAGKNNIAYSLYDATLLAAWVGGGYVWKNTGHSLECIGWINACENCCYEVFSEMSYKHFQSNVSAKYY